jgi:hypothetical protein
MPFHDFSDSFSMEFLELRRDEVLGSYRCVRKKSIWSASIRWRTGSR